jgi:hypothetical protein
MGAINQTVEKENIEQNCDWSKYYAHLSSREHFYLCLLLTAIKDATSFRDLCIVNNVELSTFQEVCIHCGLFKDNGEWFQCLEKAKDMQSEYQLHSLFVTVLAVCNPTQLAALWKQLKENIYDDL